MQRITIRLSDALHAALEERATTERRDLSTLARHLISDGLGVTETEELDKEQNPELKGMP